MKKLHPKVLELRKSLDSSPFRKAMNFDQPKNVRSLNVRAAGSTDDNDRLIKAYHCIFGMKDSYGTIFNKGCFAKSIEQRGPDSSANYKIAVLYMHDQKDPLCIPKVLKEDEIGLYSEWEPDDVPSGNRTVKQVRSGTINNFSFGFNYLWDERSTTWNDELEAIMVNECMLLELSPVTIGGQLETYAVRGADGKYTDDYLLEDTEDLIRAVPRAKQLELRQLIDRHISLAKFNALELRHTDVEETKPIEKASKIDLNYITKNLNF